MVLFLLQMASLLETMKGRPENKQIPTGQPVTTFPLVQEKANFIHPRSRLQSLNFESMLPDNPEDYDNLQPPKTQDDKPTVVQFHVTVLSIDTIDEGSMTYVADVFMSMAWRDHRLLLPANLTTHRYRLLPVGWLRHMWRPDSFFKNAKRVTFQTMTVPNHYIWLYGDNTILYMVKLTLELSCAMKFESYPHDTQTCAMKIESLSYTTDDLVFEWQSDVPLVVEENIELPQHVLVDTRLSRCTKEYSTGNFTCIEVSFVLERRLGYFLFHAYVPTCLIVVMSWISFWIRADAVPARVTLCVTSLLTLATQHAQSQRHLPPVSYVKAIDVFMSTCTLFVFASLMEYACVNIVIGRVEERQRMQGDFLRPKQELHERDEGEALALRIDKTSRLLFPSLFLLLNMAYWAHYLRPRA